MTGSGGGDLQPLWRLAWALFGVAIRGFLTDPRRQRLFNLLMAGTLLVLAVMFLR